MPRCCSRRGRTCRPPDGRAGQFAFANGDRVHNILKESGWADIEYPTHRCRLHSAEKELICYLTRLGPVGGMLQEADDRAGTHVIQRVRAAFDPYVHGAEARFTAACWMVRASAFCLSSAGNGRLRARFSPPTNSGCWRHLGRVRREHTVSKAGILRVFYAVKA